MIDLSSLPEGTKFFAKDDLPVVRLPGESPKSAVSGVVLEKLDELEVISRDEFFELVARREKNGSAPVAASKAAP